MAPAAADPPSRAVEVLIHVAAPTTAAADAHHRRLARAYLAFDPAARTSLSAEPAPAASLLDEASQDLSFRSVWRGEGRCAAPAPAPDDGFCHPESQVADSYPMPDAAILTVTPERLLRRFLSFDLPPSWPAEGSDPGRDADVVDVPSSLPVPGRHGHESSPDAALPRPSLSRRDNVIPVTPLAPPPRSSGADDALVDVTHISSSSVSQPAVSSPRCTNAEPASDDARGHAEPGSVHGTADADADAQEITPPSPPVGTAHVDAAALVSDKLAKLARDLSSRYRPEPARRVLDPLERGYWLVDCSDWPPHARRETFVFLTNYLRSGLAGWGVWCRRAAPEPPRRRLCIRLYGWACVAKHTYLLLYLASGRRVKATGAAWHGADGLVALEVAPSGAPRP